MQARRIALLAPLSSTTSAIIAGMDAYSRTHGLPWTLTTIPGSAIHAGGLQTNRRHDGVVGFLRKGDGSAAWARSQGCPLIQLSVEPAPAPHTVCIRGDDEAIGALAARHCLDQGYRSFACFLRHSEGPNPRRLKAFIAELARFGHACHELMVNRPRQKPPPSPQPSPTVDTIEADFVAWLRALPGPVAYFCHQDREAFHAIEMCTIFGVAVPTEVAVLGVDDIVEVCEAARPPLSSVAMPWRHIGELAALHLHRMLGADPDGQEIRIAPRYVATRASTAAPIPTDPMAAACLAIIEREFAGPLRADTLAERLGVHTSTLYRRLRQATGASFEHHLHRVRIAHGRDLLRAGDEPVATIAARVGYPRRETFHTHFRRLVGCTPQTYRQR